MMPRHRRGNARIGLRWPDLLSDSGAGVAKPKEKSMGEGLEELNQVANQLTPWELDIAKIITEIPSGRLAT